MIHLLIAAALLAAPAQQKPRADLAGSWVLDAARSDDPNERVRVANRPTGGGDRIGSRPGGVRGGLGGTSRMPGRVGGRTGLPGNDREIPRDTTGRPARLPAGPMPELRGALRLAMDELIVGADTLQLALMDSTVSVAGWTAFPHGRETLQQRFGRDARIKAEWKKNKLVIETRIDKDFLAREEYEIVKEDELRFLKVHTELRLPNGRTVKADRYYSRIE